MITIFLNFLDANHGQHSSKLYKEYLLLARHPNPEKNNKNLSATF